MPFPHPRTLSHACGRQSWIPLPDTGPPLNLAPRRRLNLTAYAIGNAAVPDVFYIPDFVTQARAPAASPLRSRIRVCNMC
jgi:hypothetical protein